MNQPGKLGVAIAVALAAVANAHAQPPLAPAPTTKALLGEMVHQAAVIIAGEVYAIQMPKNGHGLVQADIRIDQGVRGGYIGMSYVLKETPEEWKKQGEKLLKPQQRYVLLLKPPNADGTTAPVDDAMGVLPIDKNFNVDLERLHAAIKQAQNASGAQPSKAVASSSADANTSDTEQMPELDQPTVSFLALLRDLYVLAGSQNGPAAPQNNHSAPAAGH